MRSKEILVNEKENRAHYRALAHLIATNNKNDDKKLTHGFCVKTIHYNEFGRKKNKLTVRTILKKIQLIQWIISIQIIERELAFKSNDNDMQRCFRVNAQAYPNIWFVVCKTFESDYYVHPISSI